MYKEEIGKGKEEKGVLVKRCEYGRRGKRREIGVCSRECRNKISENPKS